MSDQLLKDRALCDHLELAAERAENDGRLVDAALLRAASVRLSDPPEGEEPAPTAAKSPSAAAAAPSSSAAAPASHKHVYGPDGKCASCGAERKRKPRGQQELPVTPDGTPVPPLHGPTGEEAAS